MIKKYWILKSEPSTWSWQDQIKEKITKGKISAEEFELIEKELETFRDKSPTIFNIETTNY